MPQPIMWLVLLLCFVVVQGERFPLRASGAQEFLIAESNDTMRHNGQRRIVARSYGGNPWEVVPDGDFEPIKVTCTPDCGIDTAGNYTVRSLPVPPELTLTDAELASRFLLQTTFGSDKATIESFRTKYGSDFGAWIIDQMNLPATLSRSYFRERVSARMPLYIPDRLINNTAFPGIVTKPCDLNSRWNRYVFDQRDLQQTLVVEKGASSYLLMVGGYLRGEVDNFLGQPFPGTNITFSTPMRICAIREGVNNPIKLSAANDTTCLVNWINPPIKLTNSAAVEVLTGVQAVFVPVIGSNASYILKTRTTTCKNASDAGGNAFISHDGVFYRFDPRIRLIANIFSDPTPLPTNGECPIVPRSVFNSNTCARRPACKNLPGTEEACGSHGEVPDRPELGWHYMAYLDDTYGELSLSLEWPAQNQRDFVIVINNIHFKSVDQLRQRIAWSLSNILTISFLDQESSNYPESWLSFYDVFIRNALGNFYDVLKEVSYHPLMGSYLTYTQNKAFAVSKNYPDENYAREIMQLFSIGLYKLNSDGTQKLDGKKNPMNSYTGDDIVDFSRVWTGFDRNNVRGNLVDLPDGVYSTNRVDPLRMRAEWHDRFPKTKLDSGYLGDAYPLCDELPPRPYLLKGAQYEFSGNVSIEGPFIDAEDPVMVGKRGRLAPTTNSPLYQALCAPVAGRCTFPLRVTLPATLPCTGAQECSAARVLAVKIYDAAVNLTRYYSFVPPVCVRLTLFNEGRLLKRNRDLYQCADPTHAVGAPACCPVATPHRPTSNFTAGICSFANEVTDYQTNVARCAAVGGNLTICNSTMQDATTWGRTCASDVYQWTDGPCTLRVQIYPTGRIGIVDPRTAQFPILKNTSNNVFRVYWQDGAVPTAQAGKCPDTCLVETTLQGDSCICPITVTSTPVFKKFSDLKAIAKSAVASIARLLFIGSAPPDMYEAGTYNECTRSECTALAPAKVWQHKDDAVTEITERTIFELPPYRAGRRVRYLRNRVSTVIIAGNFSFRNPPHFSPLLGELSDVVREWRTDALWNKQATYDVEALLEHLFEHDNTAPFIAYRLIQQLINSNPSSRFVLNVVNAFRTGFVGTKKFSGVYGDLGATVYAIFMDPEARSPVIEADPTFGMFRDPYIKLFHLLRSLEYQSPIGRELGFEELQTKTAVQAFTAPSVFGFYLPEYRPDGPVTDAGLVSPTAQIATPPNVVSFLNGAISLIDNGLTSCAYGFGQVNFYGRNCGSPKKAVDGALMYTPANKTAEQVVSELDLVLTAGRLSSATRNLLISEFGVINNATSSPDEATRHVTKLLVASPDFQANSINMPTTKPRPPDAVVKSQKRRLKAVVVIFKAGGSDSFNMLVPHSNCKGPVDLYEHYKTVRGDAHMNKTWLLPIPVPTGTQPCDTFAVHKAMPSLQDLYKNNDALFVANCGALLEPLTGQEFLKGLKRAPPSVGAHNIMQRSLQNMDPNTISAKGLLGRLRDELSSGAGAFKTEVYTLQGAVKMVQGTTSATTISTGTITRLQQQDKLGRGFGNFSNFTSDAVFAETYSRSLNGALRKTEEIIGLINSANLTNSTSFGTSWLGSQMRQVAKLMVSLSNTTDTERVMFYTATGGFDTHETFNLDGIFGSVDSPLGAFAAEMKSQGLWDDVVVVSVSDFGRTLTDNGRGTDHAWGGNHFVAGGNIKGGQILGSYPEVLSDEGTYSFGRGRLVPSTSFEAIWKPIAEWMGLPASQMSTLLPNHLNFPANQLFTQQQFFKVPTPGGTPTPTPPGPVTPTPDGPEAAHPVIVEVKATVGAQCDDPILSIVMIGFNDYLAQLWVTRNIYVRVNFVIKTCEASVIPPTKRQAVSNMTSDVLMEGELIGLEAAVIAPEIPAIVKDYFSQDLGIVVTITDVNVTVDGQPIEEESSGLSGGAIAGIVVGSIVGLIVLTVIVVMLMRKKDAAEFV